MKEKLGADIILKYPSYVLAILAKRAYDEKWKIFNFLKDAKASAMEFFVDKKTDSLGFGFVIDNHIILSFRGTEKSKDWIQNLDLRRHPLNGGVNGYVHEGFYRAGGSLYKAVEAFVKKHNSKKDKLISIGGHSLGGAIAVDITRRLREDHWNILQVRTIGQPRYANPKACQYLDGLFNCSYVRWANNNDIVPQMPSFLTWRQLGSTKIYVPALRRWKHFGQQMYITRRGRIFSKISSSRMIYDQIVGYIQAWSHKRLGDGIKDHDTKIYIKYSKGY